jgi:hypothetical protein
MNYRDETRQLIAPLVYRSKSLQQVITVPAGFEFDGPSVPRLPGTYILFGGKGQAAGVLHDFLYSAASPVTRAQADATYREALEVTGHGWFVRNAMYLGVRSFGWRYFKGTK